ncbi:alanine racemase [Alphaproteobacteria bacterium]|nr:alanine racemase [Alphaproteobacteria bacterium]
MLNPNGKLTIDLGALKHNYDFIQSKVGLNCLIGAVVKANAFGLGAKMIAGALIEAGCNNFFVAGPNEAMDLRENCKDVNIFVLSGFYQSCGDLYLENNLTPVIGSFMEIEAYAKLGEKHGRKLPAFLHFNTRMNRLGLGAVEQEELWSNMKRLEGIEVTGVMSHLACADDPDHEMNATQLGLFQKITDHFPKAIKALSNSSGIFCGDHFHFDMVRPGYVLYGGAPITGQDNPMKPVVSLQVPIIRTRIVYPDAVVGYGATYRFEEECQIATVSAGYADGIFRSLGNKGAFYWNGIRCPIRGRVSMDLTTVDLSAVPKNQRPKPGDYLEVLGPNQTIDDLAADAGTIGYEILTALSNRYERQYI